jgi:VanZ family protein
MGVFYWLSSIPGTPLADDPALYGIFQRVPPSVQSVLHLPAYAILASAWCWALAAWLPSAPVARTIGAFLIASVYGVFDEWHQSFVPGRYASLIDVTLNVAGAALGIWLAGWIRSRVAR